MFNFNSSESVGLRDWPIFNVSDGTFTIGGKRFIFDEAVAALEQLGYAHRACLAALREEMRGAIELHYGVA